MSFLPERNYQIGDLVYVYRYKGMYLVGLIEKIDQFGNYHVWILNDCDNIFYLNRFITSADKFLSMIS